MRRLARPVTTVIGIVSLTLAVAATFQPDAFGSDKPRPQRTAAPRPPVVAGDPFAWPAGIAIPGDSKKKSDPTQQQGNVAMDGTVSGLVVVTGPHPFALVDGAKDPILIGSHFAGSTVRDITPLGVLLADGRLIQADGSKYATTDTSTQVQTIPSIQRNVPNAPYNMQSDQIQTQTYPENNSTPLPDLYNSPARNFSPPPLPYNLTPPPAPTSRPTP